MPRRSWRDLGPGAAAGGSDLTGAVVGEPDGAGPGAARLDGTPPPPAGPAAGPEVLHRAAADVPQLAGLLAEREQLESRLTGLIGPAGTDQDPRFPVTGLQERRAEIASWAAARDTRAGARAGGPRTRPARTVLGAGRPGPGPHSLTEAGAGLRSPLFGPLRSGLARFDQVRSALDRSDDVLERPRQLAAGLEERWQQAEEQITGPLDRFGRYAEVRDRILDVTTGGSGDLTARAEAARRRALEQRSVEDREERRAARRRERHHEHRAAEQRETDRLDRRTSAGKGD